MPVQINELIIRANVVEEQNAGPVEKTGTSGDVNKEEIIRECVAHVLDVINKKMER